MLLNTKWLTIMDSSHMYDENHCVFGMRKMLRDDISVGSSVVLYTQVFPYGCRSALSVMTMVSLSPDRIK